MMNNMKLIFEACACVALLSSAANPRGESQVASKGAAAVPEYPVILRLVSRAETITVRAGPAGPLYSAHAPDGSAIVVNVTLDELRNSNERIYKKLRPVVATDTAFLISSRAGD